MENIRQAVERAKRSPSRPAGIEPPQQQARHDFDKARPGSDKIEDVQLDLRHLESKRIVAYDGKNARSRSFDILRTEVLRSMDLKGWKTLAVTSPTPGCGKTLIAANLALSIARQLDRQVLLADLDLRKPQVASCLGLKCRDGVLGVVEERIELGSAIIPVRAGSSRLEVLPTAPTSNSSDLVASNAMREFLHDMIGRGQSQIIILDLPPLLVGHDAMSVLPHVDCVLLVAAVGTSKVSEIEECNKYLEATDVVRVVLNKVTEADPITRYTSYY